MQIRHERNTVMSTTYVPLISSGVAGPLGVLHLPRLWLKTSLDARGKLAPDYPAAGKGYDQMVIDGLGLDRNKFICFIGTAKPTYPELETWVKSQPGVKLDEITIEKLNASINGYIHGDDERKRILGANGLPDGPDAPMYAITLNNLDDWKEFHEAVLKDEQSEAPATETTAPNTKTVVETQALAQEAPPATEPAPEKTAPSKFIDSQLEPTNAEAAGVTKGAPDSD